jgi:putative spermidine/putrescine transport system substrate-binding protein
MEKKGTIDAAAAAALPKVTGTPQFPTQAQSTAAGAYLASHWSAAIG